jgi:transketolase
VVNLATIRPLDAELVERCARETGRLVTVEDHQVTGGLGSAVVEALADRYPVPVLRIGLPDCFGESGPPDVLCARYGLDARGIAERTQAFLTAWAGGGPLAGSPGSATSAPISIH